MFKRNTAVVGFGIGNFINAATGAVVTTGSPTCKRTLDGTAGSCANAAVYDATGLAWKITLAAGDMNAEVVVLSFSLTDCLPIVYTIHTVPNMQEFHVGAGQQYTTIGAAVTALEAAGDTGTIFVHPGAYAEAVVVSSGKKIHFVSTVKHGAIVSPAAADAKGFNLRSGCSLDGFYVTADERAVMVTGGGSDVVLKNCYLGATGTGGAEDGVHALSVHRLIIDNCQIYSTYDGVNNSGGSCKISNSNIATDGSTAPDCAYGFRGVLTGNSSSLSVIERTTITAGAATAQSTGDAPDIFGIVVGGAMLVRDSNIAALAQPRYNFVPEEVSVGTVFGIKNISLFPVSVLNTIITTGSGSALPTTMYDLYAQSESGYFVVNGLIYDAAKTLGTIKDIQTDVDFIQNILEGDVTIDKTGTPWQLVVKIKDTATELSRKDLKDVDGTDLSSTATAIGQVVEP